MKTAVTMAVLAAAWFTTVSHAQHSPYAGQQQRAIKALSAGEIEQYLVGAGMGYARAAELNRYPGPMHVLELADSLALTPAQRTATEKLMSDHKREARAIGARLVDAERALDQLFADMKADESELARQVRAVAVLQGEFRLAHLDTHRRMRALLTPEQIESYARLRGYGEGAMPVHHHKP